MKRFAKLRGRMAEMDVKNKDLANYLGKSRQYISAHMLNKNSWEIDVVYKILDFLQIPYEEILVYFPPNGGISQENKVCK